MNIIITKNYEEMSKVAMTHVLAHMYTGDSRRVNLSVTAGKTPIRLYEMLVPEVRDNQYLSHVHYYNFDEIPRAGEDIGVTMSDLNQYFFHPAKISGEQIEAFDLANWEGYDQKIAADGGLDMMLLGLGLDGHFCGNLAGTVEHFGQESRMVHKMDGVPYFEREGSPDRYVTFGPKTVMQARHLIMIINGKHKAEITQKALCGSVDPRIPASVFQLHPHYTVILDEEAAALL
ncbi:MAG: glucosamine-6-phosphate deaminase [Lachnospiraceae bacterium]